jgi:murein DD-endopeptidase MepM/ murein hydrolase activator NlpD
MIFPTDQKALLDGTASGAFQPTASGRPESGLFGSVRTEKNGKGFVSSFHEGIDIAALHRDRRGQPLDSVYAAADGSVAYANRIGGNSNYGKYVVLVHASTAGQIYTLYAHLSRIAPEVKAGQPVKAGAVLGIMGNTSSSPIPMARGHLHFEIGLMANAGYDRWYRAQKLKPDHGIYNGGNLIGIDPLAVFQAQRADPEFMFAKHLATIPRAFEVVLATTHALDFFRRYLRLWDGPVFNGHALVMAVSENGLPLRGWNAAEQDVAELGKQKWRIRNVNAEALGRNGCRLVSNRQGTWTLSSGGERWLEILAYENLSLPVAAGMLNSTRYANGPDRNCIPDPGGAYGPDSPAVLGSLPGNNRYGCLSPVGD